MQRRWAPRRPTTRRGHGPDDTPITARPGFDQRGKTGFLFTIDVEVVCALLGVEFQDPIYAVEEEPQSIVSACPVLYVDLETEIAIIDVLHGDKDVLRRSDDSAECAFRNLWLVKRTAEVGEETTDGPGKNPDQTCVHVVKWIPSEKATSSVRAVQTSPKVQNAYQRMDIEPGMASEPRNSVCASLLDLVECSNKDRNSRYYDIALKAMAVLGLLYWATRKLDR